MHKGRVDFRLVPLWPSFFLGTVGFFSWAALKEGEQLTTTSMQFLCAPPPPPRAYARWATMGRLQSICLSLRLEKLTR